MIFVDTIEVPATTDDHMKQNIWLIHWYRFDNAAFPQHSTLLLAQRNGVQVAARAKRSSISCWISMFIKDYPRWNGLWNIVLVLYPKKPTSFIVARIAPIKNDV